MCLFGGDRQGESKRRAVRLVWRRGQLTAVGLDDRTADRQAHPHAARLGGVEGIEHRVGSRRVEPWSRVADLDEHHAGTDLSSDQLQLTWPVTYVLHRLDGIHHQIQDDLLDLNAVCRDEWLGGGQAHVEHDRMPLQVAAQHGRGLGDRLVDVQRPNTRGHPPEECADAADNVAGAPAVPLDQAEVVSSFLHVRWLSRQPAERRTGVGNHAGERLVDLVRDRRGHLAHQQHTIRTREICLSLL